MITSNKKFRAHSKLGMVLKSVQTFVKQYITKIVSFWSFRGGEEWLLDIFDDRSQNLWRHY